MEASESRISDDVFSTPPEYPYPRITRLHLPESPSPSRRKPYSGEGSAMHTNQHLSPPLRRGSPLNPQRVPGQDRRRPSSNDGPSDSMFRTRRSPPPIGTDDYFAQNLRSIPGLDAGANEASAFSDEYDLYPRILQDVQRALRLKARREAKMKTSQQISSETKASPSANVFPAFPSPRTTRSPTKHTTTVLLPVPSSPSSTTSVSTPPRKFSMSNSSDIDFSPSTKRPASHEAQHPVPSSLDNGLTLDWSGSTHDEEKSEKKWAISVRRREKDRLPPLEMMQDQQEKTHRERLSKLRASVSSQTIRKAAMTSDQLQRRYDLIEESLGNNLVPLNLVMVTQWYGSQDEKARQELENAEPLTWLKHLPRRKKTLSRWHLSARIVEEFIRAKTSPQRMESIPEDQSLRTSVYHPPANNQLVPERILLAQSPRSSFDVESRISGESGLSSVISTPSNPVVSPNPSTQQHERARPASWTLPRRETTGSEAEEFTRSKATTEASPGKLMKSSQYTAAEPEDTRNQAVIDLGENMPKLVLPLPDVSESAGDQVPEPKPSPGAKSRSNVDLSWLNRKLTSPPEEKEVQNEEAMRQEYEQKNVLLADAMAHNQRIRHLLNRISISVKDYDTVQRIAMGVLGKKYYALPKELVESFGHDPAAVTSSTKRLKGWRAVEDIHQRLVRQREVFAAFLASEPHKTSDYGSILDDQVASLSSRLSYLEDRKGELAKRAKEVESVLREVRKVHKEVKDGYNKTVSLTSALYPELSQAVALEESYKDHYQQIWEWGMDALTILLDTVTPFWRTYGKTIGEDIRDFLIIPLYRNEFTGEIKRYHIEALPKRSPRHWLGLGMFFLSSILVSILQARAAISSSIHFRLRLIPYDGIRYTALPFFWVGIFIQWLAVSVEFGIVFVEMGVIAWWLGWTVNLLT